MRKSILPAIVYERRQQPGCWGVEAIDNAGDGVIFLTVFSGPEAKARAVEYAGYKYDRVEIQEPFL